MTKTTEFQNGRTIMGLLKQYWWVIAIIIALIGRGTIVEMSVAGNSKKIDKQDETLQRVVRLQEKMNGQLTLILRVLLPGVSDSTLSEWKKIPQALEFDENGEPIDKFEWLDVSDDYCMGRLMRWHKGDSIMVNELWKVKEE